MPVENYMMTLEDKRNFLLMRAHGITHNHWWLFVGADRYAVHTIVGNKTVFAPDIKKPHDFLEATVFLQRDKKVDFNKRKEHFQLGTVSTLVAMTNEL